MNRTYIDRVGEFYDYQEERLFSREAGLLTASDVRSLFKVEKREIKIKAWSE